jgi:hypothetical protein
MTGVPGNEQCPSLAWLDALPGSRFHSEALGLFARRAARVTPAELRRAWEENRFCAPSDLCALALKRLELTALECASRAGFIPLQLSPVCPFGTASALAPVHQNKVVSAIRGTEVVSDSTNVMALECARRRSGGAGSVRLASCHRLLRGQVFVKAGATAHFGVPAFASAGRDTGSFKFEAESLAQHLITYESLLRELEKGAHRFGARRVMIYGGSPEARAAVGEALTRAGFPGTWDFVGPRPSGSSYYPELSFKLRVGSGEDWIELGDGGFTDWTQKLLSDRKERLLISGIGLDMLERAFRTK